MKIAKRLLAFVGVVALLAGLGFYLRPVSYFSEMTYVHEYFSGIESHTVDVSGYRVHYIAEGPATGPVVVLVHGLGASAEDWLNLLPYFTKAGFRVYAPDLPGFGRSQEPAGFSYTVTDQAAIVVGFMDALDLKQVDLGGWSMGGWIAQIVAGAHPERVQRLMLFDAAGMNEKPNWDTHLFTPNSPARLDQFEALLMPNPKPVPAFVARDVIRILGDRAWITNRAMDSMLMGREVTDSLLPTLKMPVLIVWGAEDRITPVNLAEKMHALVPRSELAVFAGCGHLAARQCSNQVGPRVIDFVKQ